MSKRTYLAAAAIAAVALTVVVGAVVIARGDDSEKPPSANGPSITPSATQPPAGIAPGEPTPPTRSATVGPTIPGGASPPPAISTPGVSPTLAAGLMRVPAPIDGAEVQVRDTTPRYVLVVKAGLPSGCAKPDTFTVSQTGNVVKVAVSNTLPTGNPVCTAIYGTYELDIDVGTNFAAGQEYRVDVNGRVVTFTAR